MVAVLAAMLLAHPIVIAHRGASALRPEHTLESYERAIDLGADYIEPDVVITKDGVLIARHENEISSTTDVANHPEFADRKTTKTIDGQRVTGWFTEDFTVAEIKTLRAKERLPILRPKNKAYDGKLEIPTLEEIVALIDRKDKRVGIYPETKHPTYFASIGKPLEVPLAAFLRRHGFEGGKRPVFVQSFEPTSLIRMKALIDTPRVQLLDTAGSPFDFQAAGDKRTFADLAKPEGLRYVKTYADAVGLAKDLVIPRDESRKLLPPSSVVRDAHAVGLKVHVWTFRDEPYFLPAGLDGDAQEEYRRFLATGIDGLFADNPKSAREAVDGKTSGHTTR